MNTTVELVAYDPVYLHDTAQAVLSIFSLPPWNETYSYNDMLSQLESDQSREGFGGVLVKAGREIAGFSWWFDISGNELDDRWRRRFAPKDQIPKLTGRGSFLMEFGVKPTLRHHGLGHRLLKASLEQIEPDHDWIAVNTNTFAEAALALLKSHGFEDLGLKGVQVPTRIALIKTMHR